VRHKPFLDLRPHRRGVDVLGERRVRDHFRKGPS
jgi:hypothetical protein